MAKKKKTVERVEVVCLVDGMGHSKDDNGNRYVVTFKVGKKLTLDAFHAKHYTDKGSVGKPGSKEADEKIALAEAAAAKKSTDRATAKKQVANKVALQKENVAKELQRRKQQAHKPDAETVAVSDGGLTTDETVTADDKK